MPVAVVASSACSEPPTTPGHRQGARTVILRVECADAAATTPSPGRIFPPAKLATTRRKRRRPTQTAPRTGRIQAESGGGRCPSSHREPDPQLAVRGADAAFPFDDDGHHRRDRRRPPAVSSYFVPIPAAKKKGKQLELRDRVDAGPHRGEQAHQPDPRAAWATGATAATSASRRRHGGCWTTGPTRPREEALLLPDRGAGDRDLPHRGGAKVRRRLDRERAARGERRLTTPACSASPSRWPPARARPSSWRCSSPGTRSTSSPTRRTPASRDTFLIVTPGITIRDRLRVLLPNDPEQLLPPARPRPAERYRATRAGEDRDHQLPRLPAARDASTPARRTKQIARRPDEAGVRSPRRPTRWCAASAASSAARGTSSCSTTRPTTATAASPTTTTRRQLTGDERAGGRSRARRRKPASGSPGLEAVEAQDRQSSAIYDLSATPFFLRGSGYPEGHALPLGGLRLLADRRHRVRASSRCRACRWRTTR